MSDLDFDRTRYATLSDRLALGEPLTGEERAFLERMEQREPSCRLEQELYAQLEALDEAVPSEHSRALVEGALAELAKDGAVRAQPRKRAPRVRLARIPLVLGSAGLAAAAALAFGLTREVEAPAPGAENANTRTAQHDEHFGRIELVFAAGDVRIDGVSASDSARLLREGSVLSVREGSACLAMDPAIDVCAASGSELRLTRTASAARQLDLLQGRVAVQLEKQPEGSKLSIVSDGVWSTAIGTVFSVEQSREHGVRTTVLEGKVGVSRGEREPQHVVAAHQRSVMTASEPAVVSAIGRSDESPEWALLAPARLWHAPMTATLELSDLPEDARAVLDDQELGMAPIATLVPVGQHRVEVRLAGAAVWSRELRLSAGQHASFSLANLSLSPAVPAAVERRSAGARRTPAVATPSAATLLTQARRALRAGEHAEAAAIYEALLEHHPRSEESRIGLLSLAELEIEHLRQPSAALAHADRYLAAGSGALRPEAEETRIRALRALGRRAEERDAIEAYLDAHPESLRAGTLAKRLDALQIQR